MTASVATDGIPPALAATFRDDAAAAVEWVANYLETVSELPVLAQVAPGDLVRSLPSSAPLEAEPFEEVLRDLDRLVIPATTHWNHPRFFAYFPHTGSEPGILAELLIAALNVNGLLWRTSPAATELEEVSLRWLAQLLGLPEAWFGQIQESASLSTLGALAAAREAGSGRRLVLCSEEAHSSVEKATRLLELDLRKLPVDDAFRMRPEVLAHELRRRDVAAVVATVGTTSTTAVDPIDEIGLLCERAGAWLHVDGAYAAAAGVCPEFRWALAGVERADSFVVNAHKWLCMPAECSCLYTARPEAFRSAFSVVPEYLRTDDDGATNLMDYSPTLSRRMRALKLWVVLRCYGVEGLQARVREAVRLAALLEGWIRAEPGWEVSAPRMFSAVCFRMDEPDETNDELLRRVNETGRMFLSHTRLGGRFVLRLVVGNARTTEADLALAWLTLREQAAYLRSPVPVA